MIEFKETFTKQELINALNRKKTITILREDIPDGLDDALESAQWSYYNRTGTGGCLINSAHLRALEKTAKLLSDAMKEK